jgi:hypothetical protein
MRDETLAPEIAGDPAPLASPWIPAAAPPIVPAALAPAASAPAPAAPVSKYRRARTLLQEGHDLVTIQAMTGLKRAEIDLVRCVPSLGVAP